MRADERTDCDSNAILDHCELTSETDCNSNGVLDVCELTSASDCNDNGVLDVCELTPGTDCNSNGVLDECESDDLRGVGRSGPFNGNRPAASSPVRPTANGGWTMSSLT